MKDTCRQKTEKLGIYLNSDVLTDWSKIPNDGDNILTAKDIDLGVIYYMDNFGWVPGLEYLIPFTSNEGLVTTKPYYQENNSNYIDEKGLSIMESCGTWGESIESLLPLMSSQAIEKMLIIYIDRHIFPGISTSEDIKKVEQTIQVAYSYITQPSIDRIKQYIKSVQ